MERDFSEIIKEKAVYCISGKPMSTSKYLNMVALDYAPEWEFPVEANFLLPNRPKRAVAIVHDDEVTVGVSHLSTGKVKFAIEVKGEEIIYHPVEHLKQIRYEEES